jgi:hypothetical protein
MVEKLAHGDRHMPRWIETASPIVLSHEMVPPLIAPLETLRIST